MIQEIALIFRCSAANYAALITSEMGKPIADRGSYLGARFSPIGADDSVELVETSGRGVLHYFNTIGYRRFTPETIHEYAFSVSSVSPSSLLTAAFRGAAHEYFGGLSSLDGH